MNKRPHAGWQEGVEKWNLWYSYRVDNDLSARDALFEGYYNQCTRILAKHVTYADQRDQTREDAVQESAILTLTIMGEFNPMRAESFKAYIISYGTKRAIDVARTRSVVPRRAREATAIYNEAREQLSAAEGTLRSNSKPDMEAILNYAVDNDMWPKWLGNPTVEKVLEAIAVRDRGLSEYSLDALASAGTANDEGRPRESVLAKVEGHEFDVIENVMMSNLRSILDYILADMPEHDREVLIAFSERPLENGTVGGVDAVREMLQERANKGLTYAEDITLEQAQKRLKDAQNSAKTSFLKNQDDILVRESEYELLEIIQRYFESVDEFAMSNLDGSGYRSSEELTLY